MSESGGRPAMPTGSSLLAVAERLDFLGETVLFLDRDPLKHLEPFLQRLHFFAQPESFPGILGLASHLPHRAGWNAHLVLDDREREHQEQDRNDKLEWVVHRVLSSAGILAWSRSASICEAV